MRYLFNTFFLFCALTASSQTNLVFFTNDGEAFTVYLNGERINNEVSTRVKAENLLTDFAKVQVIFQSKHIQQFSRGMMLEPNKEMVIEIKKGRNGRYNLKPIGVGEIPPETIEQDANSESETSNSRLSVNQSSSTALVGTSNTNIVVNETNQSVEINLNVSQSTVQSSLNVNENNLNNSECYNPMFTTDYNKSIESIRQKSFEDEKMAVFKQINRSNCLSVDQVIGFMELFTYEEEKLKVAKLAYSKTVDQNNYYQLNDALTYSDSVEELEEFLSNQ